MDLEMWKQTKDIAKRNFIWPITHGSDYKAWSFFFCYFTLIYAIVMEAAGSYQAPRWQDRIGC